MNTHRKTNCACCARTTRRPVSATLRLKFLASLNRLRRAVRPERAPIGQPNLTKVYFS